MFKIKSAIVAFMITVTMLGAVPAHAVQYVTIADIREETKDGWHETYTYKNEAITINADVFIPAIEAVPIVRIKMVNGLAPSSEIPAESVSIYENRGFAYGIVSISDEALNTPTHNILYTDENAYADNSPFSPEEAELFALEKMKPYMEQLGLADIGLDYVQAYSKEYTISRTGKKGVSYDINKPVTDLGFYTMAFHQMFYGIPFKGTNLMFNEQIKAEKDITVGTLGEIGALVASDEHYSLVFCPVVEDGVITADVPLAPFSKVKKEIEKLIGTGYIREIYNVRLIYMYFYNPDDLYNTYILKPVWQVNGILVTNPKEQTPVYSEEEKAVQRRYGELYGYFDAQTGAYYNPNDTSSDRGYAKYITWDEVK